MIHDYDTLAYHRSERPGTMARNLSQVLLRDAGKYAKAHVNSCQEEHPEVEALSFYLGQHMMHEMGAQVSPDEPLGQKLVLIEKYHKTLNVAGARLFHYVLITTTRESRHLTNSQEDNLQTKHGLECVKFTKSVKKHSQNALYNYTGDLKLGPYLDYLCDVFNELQWSSSYGGPAWGKVTEAIRDCVNGQISIEMMLDIGYTLAHNNGPIFNKGFQFKHYDSTSLYTVLDCQRGGQIPNLIKSGNCPHTKTEHHLFVEEMENLLGVTVNPWVAWDVVEKLGAVQSYSSQKAKNMQQYGHDPVFIAENKAVLEKVKLAQQQAAQKKAMEEKMYLQIMPGVKVKKSKAIR
jgi:hypothetical protein